MHYAWIILLGCCLIEAGSMGIILNCSGAFITPIAADLGIGTAQYSLSMTLLGISMACTMTGCNKLIEKFGIKRMIVVSGALA